jgi:site-specific DNA-adenine methylase
MFYYYGRKKQFVRLYPAPLYDCIIEPFAGSAAYALHGTNWKKEVILVEKDERVAAIWKWLINEATAQEISRMPDLHVGERTSEFLHIIHAATKMAFAYKTIKVTPVLARNWEISKRQMACDLQKIKHWKILTGDYREAPDIEATWFVDPPYKNSPGQGYKHGSRRLDYAALASWARSRKGQVICCEGEFGDYLEFIPLRDCKGVAGKSSKERMYYRCDRPTPQANLFDYLDDAAERNAAFEASRPNPPLQQTGPASRFCEG